MCGLRPVFHKYRRYEGFGPGGTTWNDRVAMRFISACVLCIDVLAGTVDWDHDESMLSIRS